MGNETASALEFGQMLRLIRNNSGVSQFDERVAILWRLEKRYKQLKSMFEEQSDVLAETKNTFDQLNNAYKALQVAYTELQTLAEENRESFESGQKQMIEQIGVYQQKLQKLQDSHSQEMVELTAAYEKENREADSRVEKIKAEYESLTEQQAKSSDMKLKEMKSSLSASFETSHSKAESKSLLLYAIIGLILITTRRHLATGEIGIEGTDGCNKERVGSQSARDEERKGRMGS